MCCSRGHLTRSRHYQPEAAKNAKREDETRFLHYNKLFLVINKKVKPSKKKRRHGQCRCQHTCRTLERATGKASSLPEAFPLSLNRHALSGERDFCRQHSYLRRACVLLPRATPRPPLPKKAHYLTVYLELPVASSALQARSKGLGWQG